MKKLCWGLVAMSLSLLLYLSYFTPVTLAQGMQVLSDQHLVVSQDIDGSLLASGGTVQIDGDVNGALFASGETVIVNGKVSGPVFIAGNQVTFNGQTDQDVFMTGNRLTLANEARAKRDLFAAANSLTLQADLGRDLFFGGASLTANHNIGRDAYLGVETISLNDGAQIKGNLNYHTTKENQVPADRVAGAINWQPVKQREPEPASRQMMRYLLKLIGAILVAWLLWWLAQRLFKQNWLPLHNGQEKIWSTILIGLAACLVVPILAVILFISPVGRSLGALALMLYLALMVLAVFITASALWKIGLANRFIQSKYAGVLTFLATYALLYLLTDLPYIGWLVSLICMSYALGYVVQKFIYHVKQPNRAIAYK
ncbi:hypothetical protein AWM75_08385 [Aerococcus urinaehominis]|uniref:Uncharacterized protein n=1 Tax=Aerococcus urinaehominis TaxID=128944 RepID=A0A0X8FMJ1_9LACT|nr:polymer-forming cytoskeletal protein [Aerococcus urinaehominis]AMB99987.1 hypothetical protein AWM75_08385 [Aerococcus urinaehominis]SDL82891.1 Polymer-forming protein [Aerococcus urinaehominis]